MRQLSVPPYLAPTPTSDIFPLCHKITLPNSPHTLEKAAEAQGSISRPQLLDEPPLGLHLLDVRPDSVGTHPAVLGDGRAQLRDDLYTH